MLGNPYQNYQQNAIMTASPAELTLKLYEGAIKFCNQGIESIQENNKSSAHKSLIKAQNIIEELQITLDMSYPIAQQIAPLYQFIHELLIEGNIKKDIKKIEDARDLIRQFRDVWIQIMKKRV